MGNTLIIKGADFSVNGINSSIKPEPPKPPITTGKWIVGLSEESMTKANSDTTNTSNFLLTNPTVTGVLEKGVNVTKIKVRTRVAGTFDIVVGDTTKRSELSTVATITVPPEDTNKTMVYPCNFTSKKYVGIKCGSVGVLRFYQGTDNSLDCPCYMDNRWDGGTNLTDISLRVDLFVMV